MTTEDFIKLCNANELQDSTIRRLKDYTQHGGTCDAIVRIDGVDYHFEADWLITFLRGLK